MINKITGGRSRKLIAPKWSTATNSQNLHRKIIVLLYLQDDQAGKVGKSVLELNDLIDIAYVVFAHAQLFSIFLFLKLRMNILRLRHRLSHALCEVMVYLNAAIHHNERLISFRNRQVKSRQCIKPSVHFKQKKLHIIKKLILHYTRRVPQNYAEINII